jgi:uncharacterized protein (DUF1697 family)
MANRAAALQTYVAFVRAINVGGRGLVSMSDLQEAFRAAGCGSVRTYIQSGNVVFTVPCDRAPAVFKKIVTAVRPLLDGDPTIIFRTAEDLERLVKRDPFSAARHDSTAKFYVTFLNGRPEGRRAFPLISEKEALEVFELAGLDALVISRPKSTRMYGFPNNYVEKELGVAGTTRNWSTVSKIVEFAARTSLRAPVSKALRPGRPVSGEGRLVAGSAKADVRVSVNSSAAAITVATHALSSNDLPAIRPFFSSVICDENVTGVPIGASSSSSPTVRPVSIYSLSISGSLSLSPCFCK